jgi:hypothetical protein
MFMKMAPKVKVSETAEKILLLDANSADGGFNSAVPPSPPPGMVPPMGGKVKKNGKARASAKKKSAARGSAEKLDKKKTETTGKEYLRDDVFSDPSGFKHIFPRTAIGARYRTGPAPATGSRPRKPTGGKSRPPPFDLERIDVGLEMKISFKKIQVTLKEEGHEVSRAELGNSAAEIRMFVDGVTSISVSIFSIFF